MNELQKSFIKNTSSFLVHYNPNHSKANGQFISGSGSGVKTKIKKALRTSPSDVLYGVINKLDERKKKKQSLSYESAKQVFDSLTDSEKKNLTSNGKYSDSENLISRNVVEGSKGNPVSFAEIEHDPDDKKIGYLSTATKSEFRGKGYSDAAVASVLSNAREKGLEKIYWETTTDNIASGKAAQKFGFEKTKNFSKGDDNYVYDFSKHEHPYIEYLKREKKRVKGDPELIDLINMEINELRSSGHF